MKNGKLNGKTAVVTGRFEGIGCGIAKQLAVAGASGRGELRLRPARRGSCGCSDHRLRRPAMVVQGDVSKSADVAQLFVEVKAVYGALDVAREQCRGLQTRPIEEMDPRKNSNGSSTPCNSAPSDEFVRPSKYFGPSGGSIINIGSMGSQLNSP